MAPTLLAQNAAASTAKPPGRGFLAAVDIPRNLSEAEAGHPPSRGKKNSSLPSGWRGRGRGSDSGTRPEMLISPRDRNWGSETPSSFLFILFWCFVPQDLVFKAFHFFLMKTASLALLSSEALAAHPHPAWAPSPPPVTLVVSWEGEGKPQAHGQLVQGTEIPFPGSHLCSLGE